MGPYVHRLVMEKTNDILSNTALTRNWETGSIFDHLRIDKYLPVHGYDVKNNSGNIIDMLEDELLVLKKKFKNREDPTLTIRRITHLCCDCLSIGQISGSVLWGKKDDLIDLTCELFCGRRNISIFPVYSFTSLDEGLNEVKNKMIETYELYHKNSLKWFKTWTGIPCCKNVKPMLKRAIGLGSTLAAGLIYYCWFYSRMS